MWEDRGATYRDQLHSQAWLQGPVGEVEKRGIRINDLFRHQSVYLEVHREKTREEDYEE